MQNLYVYNQETEVRLNGDFAREKLLVKRFEPMTVPTCVFFHLGLILDTWHSRPFHVASSQRDLAAAAITIVLASGKHSQSQEIQNK